MDKDIYFMNIALKEAKKALKRQEVPVGAVITYKDKVIAKGHNLRELKKDVTKHAELIVLKKASKRRKDWRLSDCNMYVTLFPCSMCAGAIIQSRLKRIIIGAPTKDLKTKEIVSQIFQNEKNESLIEITENVLQQECSKLLKKFFQNRRKNNKIEIR